MKVVSYEKALGDHFPEGLMWHTFHYTEITCDNQALAASCVIGHATYCLYSGLQSKSFIL